MFDDVHELMQDEDTSDNQQQQQPPPPFILAGTAALTTAATLALANTHLSSIAASERSVPAYLPPLRQRIVGFYERHTQLTHSLRRLGDVPVLLDDNQHEIYAVAGKVKSQEARLKTLQTITHEKRDVHAKMTSTFAKRFMNRRGKGSRLLTHAHSEAEKAAAHQSAHEAELEHNRSILQAKEQRKVELERDLIEYNNVAMELDTINSTLFDGATPEFPHDDFAEWQVRVWVQTQHFMAAEANREKRARQMLKDSMPVLGSIIKDMQTALQYCIDTGVASNTKYTKQIGFNSTAKATVSGVQSLVLRSKTNSGKFFTTIAKARGSQMLVEQPPQFKIIELNLLPGSKNPNAVNERGLHKSMESSYAEAKRLDAYVKREIASSLERQKKISAETIKLQATLEEARQHLRHLRRKIVVSVVREDAGEKLDASEQDDETTVTPTLDAEGDAESDEEDGGEDGGDNTKRTFALPLQDAANPMISTHFQENLRKEALARLRTLIALPEPDSDDDNLYPMIA